MFYDFVYIVGFCWLLTLYFVRLLCVSLSAFDVFGPMNVLRPTIEDVAYRPTRSCAALFVIFRNVESGRPLFFLYCPSVLLSVFIWIFLYEWFTDVFHIVFLSLSEISRVYKLCTGVNTWSGIMRRSYLSCFFCISSSLTLLYFIIPWPAVKCVINIDSCFVQNSGFRKPWPYRDFFAAFKWCTWSLRHMGRYSSISNALVQNETSVFAIK